MVTAKQRFEWNQTALIVSMLEGCRQNDAPVDAAKWLPDHLRPERRTVARASNPDDVKAFRAALIAGANGRKT